MARCPHCNFVLSEGESKGSACPICGGRLNAASSGSAPAAVSAEQASSSQADASPRAANSTEAGASAPAPTVAQPALAPSPTFPLRTLALLAPVALWLVLAMAWVSSGSTAATPPRLLGLALLSVPLLVVVLALQPPKADD